MIDSHLPPSQMLIMPVRPDPVPPGKDTMRPSPAPNGAEAGARHPLSDHQRDDTKVASREHQEGRQPAYETYQPAAPQREAVPAMPAHLGEELDVYV
jgi:hypothetical protein